jgi:hypothetical protein
MTEIRSTTPSPTQTVADRPNTVGRRAGIAIGAATLLIAATIVILNAHDAAEIAIVLGVLVPTAILVYGFLVPRCLGRPSSGPAALVLGILAAGLVVPAFWSGLSLVLGVAAVLVGSSGRHGPHRAGLCVAGLVLGALATFGYAAWYLLDWLS